jgi:DNA-directed RNA polymerase subunit RPC12/RpoP
MKKIEIDITKKIVEIECSNCGKTFNESFDDLAVKGSVKCPQCGHEYFIKLKK